jgi:DNA-binding MarR family transcriptional regulator
MGPPGIEADHKPRPPRPPSMATTSFTEKQGQHLAFIYMYTKVNRRPPAVTDIARFFEVTPPSAQRMVDTLVKKGLLDRTRGAARSLKVLLKRAELPELN